MSRFFSRFPLATALREIWKKGYNLQDFRADCFAGFTVSIIAIPMAMALAIAVGVAPEHGLYTAMIAGPIIALLGGSRLSVSGPTAAFVVILCPIVEKYGLSGLLLATSMASFLLIIFGILRLGKLIERIPYSVIVGFTAGIGLVVASLQIKDFFGLALANQSAGFIDRLLAVIQTLPNLNMADTFIGCITLFTLIFLSRWKYKLLVPTPIVAIVISTGVALGLQWYGFEVETIATRFQGVPQSLPSFILPWRIDADFKTIASLIGPSFTIAALCAIESLLCAAILDGLTNTRHNSNAELIAQGIGNFAISCFGGVAATSAIARSIANYRAGGRSPVSAVVHGVVILLAVIYLARLFSYIPMASLAGLLLVIAWDMSDINYCFRVIRLGSRSDALILLTSFVFTILFDMVIGVSMGVITALFCAKLRLEVDFRGGRIHS